MKDPKDLSDPGQRVIYGLDAKPRRPVMEIEVYGNKTQYYNPPSWFIPSIIFEFYERFRYYKTFGAAPKYEDQNRKFMFLWAEYENTYNECLGLLNEGRS